MSFYDYEQEDAYGDWHDEERDEGWYEAEAEAEAQVEDLYSIGVQVRNAILLKEIRDWLNQTAAAPVAERAGRCGQLFKKLCTPGGADLLAAHAQLRAVSIANAAVLRTLDTTAPIRAILDQFTAVIATLEENPHWCE